MYSEYQAPRALENQDLYTPEIENPKSHDASLTIPNKHANVMSDYQAGSNVAEEFIVEDCVAEAHSVELPQASTDDVEADGVEGRSFINVHDDIDEKGNARPLESFAGTGSVVKPMDNSR